MPKAGISLLSILALAALAPLQVSAQDWTQREYPGAPTNARGNIVAPYFDGYHQNPDGTYTLSFGFMNRNEEDLIEIPLGENNFIEPAMYDGVQPTSFPTVRYGGFGGPRERGAFAVVVPEDFEGDVWWTLTTNGYTTRVPGRITSPGPLIKGAYELSTTGMAEGSQRPIVKFEEDDPDFFGIRGIQHPEGYETSVGEPIEIELYAFDRGNRELRDVNMSLWKHQGPNGAEISFESLVELQPEAEPDRDNADVPPEFLNRARGNEQQPGPVEVGQAVRLPTEGPYANMGRFRATFDQPGQYLIRVRIDNFTSGDSSMGNQCCWSNAYVPVTVTQ